MNLDLQDTCCIVTGGTRNLGGAVTRALLNEGAIVVAVYVRDEASARTFEANISNVQRQRLRVYQCDISDNKQCEELCSNIICEFSHINILINNAARRLSQPVEDISDADFDSILHDTLRGTIYMTRAAFAYMRRTGGRIVNVSTAGVNTGNPEELLYSCAKAGVEAATRAFARAGARFGIAVNAIAPHVINAGMGESTLKKDPSIISRIPLGRSGNLDEYVNLVLWLSSPKCDYLTGQVIGLNGGRLMQ